MRAMFLFESKDKIIKTFSGIIDLFVSRFDIESI